MIQSTVLETPIGPLSLLARDGVLIASGFTADPREMYARLHKSLGAEEMAPSDLDKIAEAHTAYFAGEVSALDNIAVHQPGGWRLEKLWAVLREVRPGETVTYAELAEQAGLGRVAARVAGGACARNLIAPVVPCHRVLQTGGGLRGYYYGLDKKAWLLQHEANNL